MFADTVRNVLTLLYGNDCGHSGWWCCTRVYYNEMFLTFFTSHVCKRSGQNIRNHNAVHHHGKLEGGNKSQTHSSDHIMVLKNVLLWLWCSILSLSVVTTQWLGYPSQVINTMPVCGPGEFNLYLNVFILDSKLYPPTFGSAPVVSQLSPVSQSSSCSDAASEYNTQKKESRTRGLPDIKIHRVGALVTVSQFVTEKMGNH